MTQTVFEKMNTAISVLKLDFTTEEFATFADDQELSEESIEAVQAVFSYISEKKQQTTVYDLAGRCVAKPGKGVYIVNGKKQILN